MGQHEHRRTKYPQILLTSKFSFIRLHITVNTGSQLVLGGKGSNINKPGSYTFNNVNVSGFLVLTSDLDAGTGVTITCLQMSVAGEISATGRVSTHFLYSTNNNAYSQGYTMGSGPGAGSPSFDYMPGYEIKFYRVLSLIFRKRRRRTWRIGSNVEQRPSIFGYPLASWAILCNVL